RAFGPACPSDRVYAEGAKNIVLSALSGINASIFAYGMTSSGKTYTMEAITDLAACDIFTHIQKNPHRSFLVKLSAIEIYNEIVRDLLNPDSGPLRLLDDPERGTVVERLTEVGVESKGELQQLLAQCAAHREVGETSLNDASSRSHQIIRLLVESCPNAMSRASPPPPPPPPATPVPTDAAAAQMLSATLNFVDLAGSERASQTHVAGTRLKEGCHINRSLLTLATVIRKLSTGSRAKAGHIPYRDSKLTRILQQSLGGNGRTAIITTISAGKTHLDQTRNTLAFALRAKEVTNSACVNVVVTDRALVEQLQREVARLEGEMRLRPSREQFHQQAVRMQQLEAELSLAARQQSEALAQVQHLTHALSAASSCHSWSNGGSHGRRRAHAAWQSGKVHPISSINVSESSDDEADGWDRFTPTCFPASKPLDLVLPTCFPGSFTRRPRPSKQQREKDASFHASAAAAVATQGLVDGKVAPGEGVAQLAGGLVVGGRWLSSSNSGCDAAGDGGHTRGISKSRFASSSSSMGGRRERDGHGEVAVGVSGRGGEQQARATRGRITWEESARAREGERQWEQHEGGEADEREISQRRSGRLGRDQGGDSFGRDSMSRQSLQSLHSLQSLEAWVAGDRARERRRRRKAVSAKVLSLMHEIQRLEKLQDALGDDVGRAMGALQGEMERMRARQHGQAHGRRQGQGQGQGQESEGLSEGGVQTPLSHLSGILTPPYHCVSGLLTPSSNISSCYASGLLTPLSHQLSGLLTPSLASQPDLQRMEFLFQSAAEVNVASIRTYVLELKEIVAKLHYQKQLLVKQVVELEAGRLGEEDEDEMEEDDEEDEEAEGEGAGDRDWGNEEEDRGMGRAQGGREANGRERRGRWNRTASGHASGAACIDTPGNARPRQHQPGLPPYIVPHFESGFREEMRETVVLWDRCQVSLIRRTQLFLVLMQGEPSDRVYLQVERRRLQWLVQHVGAEGQAARERELRKEREYLAQRMAHCFTLHHRLELFRQWGIATSSRQRKRQLVVVLWSRPLDERHTEASARIVGRLTGMIESSAGEGGGERGGVAGWKGSGGRDVLRLCREMLELRLIVPSGYRGLMAKRRRKWF
ncbi:unnamed protein product, partial [Closterium sp. Naga37s-1]